MNGKYDLQGVLISFDNGNRRCKLAHQKAKDFCLKKGLFLKRFRIDLQVIDINNGQNQKTS
jgi:hypothetical protein